MLLELRRIKWGYLKITVGKVTSELGDINAEINIEEDRLY